MSRSKDKKSTLSFTVPMDPPKKRERRPAKPAAATDTENSEASLQSQREASLSLIERLLLVRLAVSAILFAFIIIADLSSALEILLLILSALIAGADQLLQAIEAVRKHEFLDDSILISLIVILSFLIGFSAEGDALIILYQVSRLMIRIMIDKSRKDALNQIGEREEALRDLLEEQLSAEDACSLDIGLSMENNSRMAFLGAKLLAVLYAVLLPILTHYSIRVAIHRAITILLVTTPFSMLAALPAIAVTGLGYAASNGTVFKKASILEDLDGTKTLILNKLDFFHVQPPKMLYTHSDVLDDATFRTFVYHVVYASGQKFASVIREEEKEKLVYHPDIVTEMKERPGGIRAKIGSAIVFFGTRSFISACGLTAPDIAEIDGVYYYLFLEGRFGGVVVLSEDDSDAIGDIVQSFRSAGVNKCALACSESADEVSFFAENSHFDDVYTGIDPENYIPYINSICESGNVKTLYLTQSDDAPRSEADLEIRVSAELGEGDACTQPEFFTGIPLLFNISRRMDELAMEDTVLVFLVKALVIFLSMIGYCNLWMAIIFDTAAAAAAIINANRVTSSSMFRTFFDKQ